MKTTFALAACLAFGVLTNVSPVEAKGCIKGAIVGGVAGKMVGHGKVAAAAVCAVGHSRANK